ncbi:plasmid maintenance system antidote protein VapI [Paenarthrobacter nicotinovorans]|uniref:hypothetical protein n=1 Tax=Micrococcaceae TaxID=1268 RepID=UPI0008774545|nr:MULTISPECIES: hypothetical protein [Micrococcaceae]MDR6438764.1 plasmid maintenance system antidote protein VapI [Paenarthrobacter nicotinovorans]SCZ56370.1 hypothetical protein SAMN02799638_01807 [Arthrobacter sp. UNCCL28]
MVAWLQDPQNLELLMNASAVVLSVLGIHLTARGAARILWNLIRKRTVVSPAGIPSESKLGDASIMRDSASVELTSSELERRVEILEHQMLDSNKQVKKLQSAQQGTRSTLNELRKDHTELSEDIDRRIGRASQESIEINAVGIPFVVAGIVLGTWPTLWMNLWTTLALIPLATLVPTSIWWRARKAGARPASG